MSYDLVFKGYEKALKKNELRWVIGKIINCLPKKGFKIDNMNEVIYGATNPKTMKANIVSGKYKFEVSVENIDLEMHDMNFKFNTKFLVSVHDHSIEYYRYNLLDKYTFVKEDEESSLIFLDCYYEEDNYEKMLEKYKLKSKFLKDESNNIEDLLGEILKDIKTKY
ncbi:MAG: hypothetical protein PUE01_08890 [Clostridiaceae bacterium]|nr:hypothetical protein [Clostridiaceae bacterium]